MECEGEHRSQIAENISPHTVPTVIRWYSGRC